MRSRAEDKSLSKMSHKEVIGRIKGQLAESIFYYIHKEMNFQVYRTGNEHLYPYLFEIANTKKKLFHYMNKEKDYEDISENLKDAGMNTGDVSHVVGTLRFARTLTAMNLAFSPDFTIITTSGNILQFEVKYRFNGELTERERKKYLDLASPPYIFMVMSVEPYIKILEPALIYDKEIPSEELLSNIQTPKDLSGREQQEFLDIEFSKAKEKYVIEHDGKKDYQEIYGGNFIHHSPFFSEAIIYPKNLLDKYKEIVKSALLFKGYDKV